MLEAGNFTEFENYQFAVMLTTNATSYLDCYEKCVGFNGKPSTSTVICVLCSRHLSAGTANCFTP